MATVSGSPRATSSANSVKTLRDVGFLTIAISGRFDFSCHQAFRAAYEGQSFSEIRVDLRDTEYIDSSALGMLLLLREAAGKSVPVRIVNCRPAVKKILHVANFQTMFPIE